MESPQVTLTNKYKCTCCLDTSCSESVTFHTNLDSYTKGTVKITYIEHSPPSNEINVPTSVSKS
jgi:hypothetical protein